MKHTTPIHVPDKSFRQEFAESIIVVIIGCFILYVVTTILKVLFWPFRYLVMSDAQIQDEDLEKAKKKVEVREAYMEKVRSNPQDPMNQYYERFTDHPEKYENDEDNLAYLQWYADWRNGKILDSRMRWCPDVYVSTNTGRTMNPEFVKYARIQYGLHTTARYLSRSAFLMTLWRYFPELSPSMTDMEKDLQMLETRVKTRSVESELLKEIRTLGVPEAIAERLIAMNLSGQELRRVAEALNKGMSLGLSIRLSEYLALNKIPCDTEAAFEANKMMSSGLPLCVAGAYVRGLITLEDVASLASHATTLVKTFGELVMCDSGNGSSSFEAVIEKKLSEIIRKNRQILVDRVLEN